MTATARTSTRRDPGALRAIAASGARELGPDAAADDVVAWTVEAFGEGLAVASSMQDAVLPHLVSQHLPGVDVLFGDTGYHFAETYDTRDRVAAELDVTVVDVRPRLSVTQQDIRVGPRLFERDPAECCRLRKVEPLRAALADYECWATGVRRADGPTRAGTPVVTFDETFGLVKVNPLATWTSDDVTTYAFEHGVPVNLLLADGYPSIGCAPCTQRVEAGADERSGRWVGFGKTECGLHPA